MNALFDESKVMENTLMSKPKTEAAPKALPLTDEVMQSLIG